MKKHLKMAFSVRTEYRVFAAAFICISVSCFQFGFANQDLTQTGIENEHDPAQIAARALRCFNDKLIYSSCDEDYRLNARGDIDVPRDCTDDYCSGPCLTETHLVLNCIDDIISNFLFYNTATIQDVRDTVEAACSDTSERGNFNVAQHMKAEENYAHKVAANFIFLSLLLFITSRHFLL